MSGSEIAESGTLTARGERLLAAADALQAEVTAAVEEVNALSLRVPDRYREPLSTCFNDVREALTAAQWSWYAADGLKFALELLEITCIRRAAAETPTAPEGLETAK